MSTAPPTTLAPTLAPTTAPPYIPPGLPPQVYNKTFYCSNDGGAGFLVVTPYIYGLILNPSASGELSVTTDISGKTPASGLSDDGSLEVITSISGFAVTGEGMKNWVGWSKIGQVSFEIDRTNDAGFAAMNWQGYVYKVIRLNKNVVIYGSGGVTQGFPVAQPTATFGFKNILNIGIKNKEACVGDEFVHFCIDIQGCLYKLDEKGLERLGYEEFLLPLVNPVMLWGKADRRLYISDATTGYIYNDKALDGGFANLTGLYRITSSLTAVSPGTVTALSVYIVTDIIDFNQRGMKCIENINWGVFADETLQAAIDYRFRKEDAFVTSDWTTLNDEGVSHQKVAGIDFRFRLKSTVHGTFDLKYANIQVKMMDRRFTRSLISSTGQPIGGRG